MQIRTLKRQVHGLSLTLLESDSNMDHNDAEQSFCLYSVNHVHILTEDNRLNHCDASNSHGERNRTLPFIKVKEQTRTHVYFNVIFLQV